MSAPNTDFTEEQKRYLEGFAAGSGIAQTLRTVPLPTWQNTLAAPSNGASTSVTVGGPNAVHRAAQDRFIAAGKKLTSEENAKRNKDGLAMWDEIIAHARSNKFPKGTDVFLFKYQGMFHVAPAQDSFMCRLRIWGGMSSAHQFRGLADLAEKYAGGYADVTTRANLQFREIKALDTINVLEGLHDLAIVNRGAGADNIRNVTASPTAGIDPQELIDTRPLARSMHHYILNHTEMYGLPRKFNIAFDGGGKISALEDTNDIGFTAVRVSEGKSVPAGIYFRLTLGGITGHEDFARDTGFMLAEHDCVVVAAAIVRAFAEHGDRTDRKKARLKYVLDRLGFDGFLTEVRKHIPAGVDLKSFPLEDCEPRPSTDKHGHVGVHEQKQPGLNYVGVVLPVGRLTAEQMRGLADLSERFGSRSIRLTVWQNLLISDVKSENVEAMVQGVEALGLSTNASNIRGGLIACTGAAGCKFAAAHTKQHAMQIAEYVESKLELDVPVNIHVTGCHNSCAQHYIGDIGLIGTKVGDDMLEGYHVYVGGGYGPEQGIGRSVARNVTAAEAPLVVERLLRTYMEYRNEGESFIDFVRRVPTEELTSTVAPTQAIAA